MVVTVDQIRTVLNLMDSDELADSVIELNLVRAQTKVDAVARYTATEALKDDAILSLAAFYSYQSHADRIKHQLPGHFVEGRWTPIAGVKVRDTTSKLNSLRNDANEALKLVRPRIGRIV